MEEKKAVSFVTISGQRIPWSFVQLVRKACGGDWDQTMDAFWKARGAKGPGSIVRYVLKGLKPDGKGNKYSLLPSKEHNDGKMQMIRVWWETEVYKPKPRGETVSIGEIFRGM